MQLTLVERLTLRNQFEILSRLGDQDHPYAEWIEILERGYEHLYSELFSDLDREGVATGVSREVFDILDVFRALDDAGRRGQVPAGATPRFAGFDANTEAGHYAFARFLIETQGRYEESSSVVNAHRPTLSGYRALVRQWGEMGKPFPLSEDQVGKLAEHI